MAANCRSFSPMPIAPASSSAVTRSASVTSSAASVRGSSQERLRFSNWTGLRAAGVAVSPTSKTDGITVSQESFGRSGLVRAAAVDRSRVATGAPPPIPAAPNNQEIDVGVAKDTIMLRGRRMDRMKYEVEYGLKRGSTNNSYVIHGPTATALIQALAEGFNKALASAVDLGSLKYLVLGQFSPKRVESLKAFFNALPNQELSDKIGERRHDGKLIVKASTSGAGAGSLGSDGNEITPAADTAGLSSSGSKTEPALEPRKYEGSLRAVGVLSAVLTIAAAAALAFTLSSGGPGALLSTVSRSGFPAAFSLIFVSEIGDKTFFIAALLAMRQNKWLVLLGASGALSVMTVISVVIGRLFRKVPASLQTTLPIGEYAAVALLLWFGLRSIKSAWDIPSTPGDSKNDEVHEIGELAEAEEFLKQVDEKKVSSPLEVLGEAFSLIFVAEWGDRSMLATIALGAAQSPWGVASGAIAGHVLATLLAVVGGALLARYLSEKMIGYFGGFLFLGFAAATLAGVF